MLNFLYIYFMPVDGYLNEVLLSKYFINLLVYLAFQL